MGKVETANKRKRQERRKRGEVEALLKCLSFGFEEIQKVGINLRKAKASCVGCFLKEKNNQIIITKIQMLHPCSQQLKFRSH